jgi:hypothetical protein
MHHCQVRHGKGILDGLRQAAGHVCADGLELIARDEGLEVLVFGQALDLWLV